MKEFNQADAEFTHKILECAYKVHTKLGVGLLESVYEECLFFELSKSFTVERQKPISIQYEDLIIKNAFKVDLVVENKIIIELKAADTISPVHEAQIINYMHLMRVPIGLLLNFKTKRLKDGIKRYYFEQYAT